jgi:ribonuclease Z
MHERGANDRMQRAQFRSRAHFEREPLPDQEAPEGVCRLSSSFRVRTVPSQHYGIVSLAIAFEERTHGNVWKNRREALGRPTDPWLTRLKEQVRARAPHDTPIADHRRTRDGSRGVTIPLGELRAEVLEIVPGQRACAVTDAADRAANGETPAAVLRGAERLFIATVLLEVDPQHVARTAPRTARPAGEIACFAAGAGRSDASLLAARPRAGG